MFNNFTHTDCTEIHSFAKTLPSTKCFKTRTIKENAELNDHKIMAYDRL